MNPQLILLTPTNLFRTLNIISDDEDSDNSIDGESNYEDLLDSDIDDEVFNLRMDQYTYHLEHGGKPIDPVAFKAKQQRIISKSSE